MLPTNHIILSHTFLADMYQDSYFPNALVDRVRAVLLELSVEIERTAPADVDALLLLTHAATEKINDLQEAFWAGGSEIETVARDCIGMDFDVIARAYGFSVDVEALIAPRDW